MGAHIHKIRSDKDTHFAGAIAQNASEEENLALPKGITGFGDHCKARLKTITLQSDENLNWEIMLFSSDTFANTDLDLDTFIGYWNFGTGAVRIAGAGQFYYYIAGLDVPYQDDDASGELHVALVNRSAATKTAGAAGEVVIEFGFEEMRDHD